MKTRITILVFFKSLLIFYHSLAKRPCLYLHSQGSQVPLRLVLVSRSVLVLSQPSDISDLVPSRLVSITLTKSYVPAASSIA